MRIGVIGVCELGNPEIYIPMLRLMKLRNKFNQLVVHLDDG
jgi:hypothetical protein